MSSKPAWRTVVSDGLVQYDYVIPASWDAARIARERARMIAALCSIETGPLVQEDIGWLALAARLPPALRRVMVLEIISGNPLCGIGSSDWPSPGSVVVNFGERFCNASRTGSADTCWRRLDDPHYCREEISQQLDGIDYLLMA